MMHGPKGHLEDSVRITEVATQMYRCGRINKEQYIKRLEQALGHMDIFMKEIKEAKEK